MVKHPLRLSMIICIHFTKLAGKMAVLDGGYGWIIVFCSFYYHLAASGAQYAVNIFYTSWVEDFESSRGITSWVSSMCFASCWGFGEFKCFTS